MRFAIPRTGVLIGLAAVLGLFSVGCGNDERKDSRARNEDKQADRKKQAEADKKSTSAATRDKSVQAGDKKADKHEEGQKEPDHSGWWCPEHGVPEHLCSICSDEVAAKCKKEGDWCEKHQRAKSQCFKCDPKLREKFAKLYRIKYNGKEPPEPTDNK